MSDKSHFRAGRILKASTLGERGFAYPCDVNTVRIVEDCVGDRLVGWKDFNGYSPYAVDSASVDLRDRYDNEKKRMVVWARSEKSSG